jgi:glucose-1-phosphate thymidylyltransferase
MASKYMGAILAAGRGTRMAPFSDSYPKPILPICNKPLIAHQIEIMKSLGITDIVVLVGHKGYEIARVLGNGESLGVSLRYVEQTGMLGIAHAVGRLEPHIDRPFLLFLGDIFFVGADLPQMFARFEEQGGGAVLAMREDEPEAIRRNFAITLSPDGFVTRVIEKPRHTPNRLKGVGLYLFDLPMFDSIRRTPRTAMRDEYEITDAIQVFIDDGYPVRAVEAVQDDINVTTPADLLRCNLMQARLTPEAAVIEGARMHDQAQIENCVIGRDVVVRNPIRIANSVLLSGSRIESQSGFDSFIVTPECVVDCRFNMQVA